MRKHNGMRPQDIVVLFKILTIQQPDWQFKNIAQALLLSAAEVTDSLNRSQLAGLVDPTKRRVHKQSLLEFIQHGLQYVFPQAPGAMVNGVPTAHAHPYFAQYFHAEFRYVWPLPEGEVSGFAIEPLYPTLPKVAHKDENLYLLLACVDIIRVGRVREINKAKEVLNNLILHELS